MGVRISKRDANTLATMNEAEKMGYILKPHGEVVVSAKLETPDVKHDKEAAEQIGTLVNILSDAIMKMGDNVGSQDLKGIVEAFHNPDRAAQATEHNIYTYALEYMKHRNASKATDAHFAGMVRLLARWEAYRNEIEKQGYRIDIDTFAADDVEDFRDYMRNEKTLSEQQPSIFRRIVSIVPDGFRVKEERKAGKTANRVEIYINKRLHELRALFTWLFRQGYTRNNPFTDVEIGAAEAKHMPYYLLIEERNKIAEFDLSAYPSLAVQRDIFIFQCLVGCRVSDLVRFTQKNIIGGVLVYVPKKTAEGKDAITARVPLLPQALSLIEKYRQEGTDAPLFPCISDQKYNKAIKRIFTLCGITRAVCYRVNGMEHFKPINEVASSHLARRTFIGNTYKKVADPNIVGKMSGHAEGSKSFRRYRNIDDEILTEAVKAIE